MKKFIVLTAALVFVSSTAFAAVSGGPHDFSSWAAGEICVPCHTPHNADPFTTGNSAPLWNHDDSTAASFNMYNSTFSSSIDNSVATSPQDRSMACLACHDGTSSMDSFGGTAASQGGVVMGTASAGYTPTSADAVIGTDLTDDHPISITYDNTVDTGLNALPVALPLYTVGARTNQVECATCHDVHGEGAGNTPNGTGFLRIANTASAMCLECHNK